MSPLVVAAIWVWAGTCVVAYSHDPLLGFSLLALWCSALTFALGNAVHNTMLNFDRVNRQVGESWMSIEHRLRELEDGAR